jgi:hypothetical protein
MSDTQAAMREFRFLDDKRNAAGLSAAEEQRWNELRQALGIQDAQPAYPQGYYASDGNWYPYPEGYDPNQAYYAQGYDPNQAYPQQGYDPNQYPAQEQGYDPYAQQPPYDPNQGYAGYPQGYDPNAYPQQGYAAYPQGYDPNGAPQQSAAQLLSLGTEDGLEIPPPAEHSAWVPPPSNLPPQPSIPQEPLPVAEDDDVHEIDASEVMEVEPEAEATPAQHDPADFADMAQELEFASAIPVPENEVPETDPWAAALSQEPVGAAPSVEVPADAQALEFQATETPSSVAPESEPDTPIEFTAEAPPSPAPEPSPWYTPASPTPEPAAVELPAVPEPALIVAPEEPAAVELPAAEAPAAVEAPAVPEPSIIVTPEEPTPIELSLGAAEPSIVEPSIIVSEERRAPPSNLEPPRAALTPTQPELAAAEPSLDIADAGEVAPEATEMGEPPLDISEAPAIASTSPALESAAVLEDAAAEPTIELSADLEVAETPAVPTVEVALDGDAGDAVPLATASEFVQAQPPPGDATPSIDISLEAPLEEEAPTDAALPSIVVDHAIDLPSFDSPSEPVPLATNAEFLDMPELKSTGHLGTPPPPPAAESLEIDVAASWEARPAFSPSQTKAQPPPPAPLARPTVEAPAPLEPLPEPEMQEIELTEEVIEPPPPAPVLTAVPARPVAPVAAIPVTPIFPTKPAPLPQLERPSLGAGKKPLLSASFVEGEHRVIVHTAEGQVRRGVVRDLDLMDSVISLELQPGAPAERLSSSRLKAIFFMNARGETPSAPTGEKIRVTFNDGRQLFGFSTDHRGDEPGFFLVPADNRTNTARIYVYRSSVQGVSVG